MCPPRWCMAICFVSGLLALPGKLLMAEITRKELLNASFCTLETICCKLPRAIKLQCCNIYACLLCEKVTFLRRRKCSCSMNLSTAASMYPSEGCTQSRPFLLKVLLHHLFPKPTIGRSLYSRSCASHVTPCCQGFCVSAHARPTLCHTLPHGGCVRP